MAKCTLAVNELKLDLLKKSGELFVEVTVCK